MIKREEANFYSCFIMCILLSGVIPLGGAKDGAQAEQNAECLGWRLTNEEVTQLESHPINIATSWVERIWQHG